MEIGGYLEFERYHGEEYHTGCLKLNTARNCLRYLIEARGIKKIWLSRWNCSAVLDTCKNSGIEIGYFDLDSDLRPLMPPEYKTDDYVYVVNYYGQVTDVFFPHMILDNVQAFFQKPPNGIDTIYTCRKYFGVTDGAYLFTDRRIDRKLGRDYSWERIGYLAGRLEKTGSEFYTSYQSNEELLDFLPLEEMSTFTENMLRSIDYHDVKERREDNFMYLHERLEPYNLWKVSLPIGPFAYPLMINEGGKLRRLLQENSIYIAKLWPNVTEPDEGRMAENILPIPCDQRYGKTELRRIIEIVLDSLE